MQSDKGRCLFLIHFVWVLVQGDERKLTSFRDFWNGGASEKGAPLTFAQVVNTKDDTRVHPDRLVASILSKSFVNLSISRGLFAWAALLVAKAYL